MERVMLLAIVLMILAECSEVATMVFSKEALSDGMSSLVFVFYSNALASLLLFPFTFLFIRSSQRPSLTFLVFGGLFSLGVLGCVVQLLGYAGINYSSPILCSAMLNLIPALTFILAIALRMEKYDWRSTISLLKTVGTITSLLGAFIVIFYDGPTLLEMDLSSDLSLLYKHSDWLLGGLFLFLTSLISSFLLILQALILKKFPSELVMAFFYTFFVAVLSAMVCLAVERDTGAWSLKSNTRFWSVLYSGGFGSIFQFWVTSWCLKRTGPVFVTMFKPVQIIISTVSGVIIFGDSLYLGRLVGGVIIIAGFYSVLWAKAKEAKIETESLESGTYCDPLLPNRIEDHKDISP